MIFIVISQQAVAVFAVLLVSVATGLWAGWLISRNVAADKRGEGVHSVYSGGFIIGFLFGLIGVGIAAWFGRKRAIEGAGL